MPADPRRVKELFVAALDVPDVAARREFLDRECGSDAELRQRLAALLAAHDDPNSLVAKPLVTADPSVGVADRQAALESVGDVVAGRYKLLQQIGEGGMGVVYMAEQEEPVRRKVALKIIKPGMNTRQVVARFEAERQALAVMDHQNIARVHDGGTTASGRPYFVMELVHGVPITEYCDANRLTPRQRLQLFVPVCHAIQHAHQKGIIHRDVKPSNVLVTMYDDKPVPKVIDFGVAKAIEQRLTEKTLFTQFGTLVGTFEYMSPEQAEMNAFGVDTRSDIYSLGVLLYELLTGTTPLERRRLCEAAFDEIRRLIKEEEPPRPSVRLSTCDTLAKVAAARQTDPAKLPRLVRGELDWLVMRCLEKDRVRRYETANDLAHDVERYLNDEPVQACPPSAGYRLRKFARRNKPALAAALVLLGALMLVGAVAGWLIRDKDVRRNRLAGQFETILAEVQERETEQRWPEALSAARRAEALVTGAGGDAALEAELQNVLRLLTLVQGLEEIRLQRQPERKREGLSSADRAYAALFHDAGIDLDHLAEQQVIDRLGAWAHVRVAVAAALDDWAMCRRENGDAAGARKLNAVAQGADPHPWRRQVRRAVAQQDAEALKKLAATPDLFQQPPSTLNVLGKALCLTAHVEQGVAMLRTAQRQYPGDFWINYELGAGLDKLGGAHRNEALAFFRIATALRPQSCGAWFQVGEELREMGQVDEAMACLTKAIDLNPQYPGSFNNLGIILSDNKRYDEAIEYFHKAIRCDPQQANGHYNLGVCLGRQKKFDEAMPAYWRALELEPNRALARRGLFDSIRRHPNKDVAIKFLQNALASDASNGLTHAALGNALWYAGRREESLPQFEKAVEFAPTEGSYFESLANSQKAMGRLDDAIASYTRAVELKVRSEWLQLEFGGALSRMGRLADAIAAWKSAVEINPKLARAHKHLAWNLATAADAKIRDATAAVHHARQARDLEPGDGNHWSNLGVALLRAGDFTAAVETLEKADAMRKGDHEHRFFLAMAYWQLGNKGKARQAFAQGVQWMEKNQPMSEELRRFRAEAQALLKVEEN